MGKYDGIPPSNGTDVQHGKIMYVGNFPEDYPENFQKYQRFSAFSRQRKRSTLCGIAHWRRPNASARLILAEERGLHVCVVLLERGGRASAVPMDAIEKKGSALGACRSGTATQTLSLSS